MASQTMQPKLAAPRIDRERLMHFLRRAVAILAKGGTWPGGPPAAPPRELAHDREQAVPSGAAKRVERRGVPEGPGPRGRQGPVDQERAAEEVTRGDGPPDA